MGICLIRHLHWKSTLWSIYAMSVKKQMHHLILLIRLLQLSAMLRIMDLKMDSNIVCSTFSQTLEQKIWCSYTRIYWCYNWRYVRQWANSESDLTIFLLQAMDLIHDHKLWGNENNFVGTVDMDDPFDSFKHGWLDNKVDEVIDVVWYKNCAGMWEDSQWRTFLGFGIDLLLWQNWNKCLSEKLFGAFLFYFLYI